MSRFVRPETMTLTLSEGDTLVVRGSLTNGEQRALFTRLYRRGPATPEAPAGALLVNPDQVGLALVTTYLLDWTLRDDEGTPVRIDGLSLAELERVLDSLTPDSFTEIHEAVAAHDAAMREARAAKKKIRTGVSA